MLPTRGIMEERKVDIHSSDREIFVTDDDRRGRRLRRGAFVATALACLWLIGLGVGMFGFGSLPGISLGSRNDDSADRGQRGLARARLSPVARPLGSREPVVVSRRQSLQGDSPSRRQGRAQQTWTGPPPAPEPPALEPPVAPPAQQPLNPAGRQRGWARRGPAPPGQVRKAQPKPPQGSRGQRRGQTQTSTTTTTPLPPGQAKKTPPPPPPPPEG